MITTTPNGTDGDGKWFHDRWHNAIDSDLLFETDPQTGLELWKPNVSNIISDPSRNTFIQVKYHWSEDPTKDEAWYLEQCQELSDQRKINQELDLIFIGSTNCIFDDEMLSSFQSVSKPNVILAPHGSRLEIFDNIDINDYYLIGCDTAESLQGAYCAIEVFSFKFSTSSGITN